MAAFSGTVELGVTTNAQVPDSELILNTNIWNGGVTDGSTTGLLQPITLTNNAALGGYAGTGGTIITTASATQFTVNFQAGGRVTAHIVGGFGITAGTSGTVTADKTLAVNLGTTTTYVNIPMGTQVNFVSGFTYTVIANNSLPTGNTVFFQFNTPAVGTQFDIAAGGQDLINFARILTGNAASTALANSSNWEWNGAGFTEITTAPPNRDFTLASTGTNSVEFNNKIISCDKFMLTGASNATVAVGTYRASNSVVVIDGQALNRNSINNRTASIFDTVDFFKTNTVYGVFGHFGTGTPSTQTWNNVRLLGDLAANGQCGLSIYYANISDDSVFNNLSLWNGLDLLTGDAKAGQIQNSSRANYDSPLFGPAFIVFNSIPNANLLVRFANQGAGVASSSTRFNHQGCLANPDFRAWQQLNDDTGQFFIDLDTGANIAIVNPLMGQPHRSANFYQTSVFNGGSDLGGRADWFMGCNVNSGTGDHRYTFLQADVTRPAQATTGNVGGMTTSTGGLAFFPTDANGGSTWTLTGTYTGDSDPVTTAAGFPNTSLSYFNRRVYDNIPNGFLFRQQKVIGPFTTNTQVTAGDISRYTNRRAPVPTYSPKSFRKYSWQQQWPSDAGSMTTITSPSISAPTGDVITDVGALPTVDNDTPIGTMYRLTTDNTLHHVALNTAGDAKIVIPFTGTTVATARAAGYTIYRPGTGWDPATTLDLVDAADPVTTTVAYNDPTDPDDIGIGVSQGADLWFLTKKEAWDRITETNVGTTNTYIAPLASHDASSGILDFGTNNVVINRAASAVTSTATSITFPGSGPGANNTVSSLFSDDFVSSLVANRVDLQGNLGYRSANNAKYSIRAADQIRVSDIDTDNGEVRGLGLITDDVVWDATWTGTLRDSSFAALPTSNLRLSNWHVNQTIQNCTFSTTLQNSNVDFNLVGTPTGVYNLEEIYGATSDLSGIQGAARIGASSAITITIPTAGTTNIVNVGGLITQFTFNGVRFIRLNTNVTFVQASAYPIRTQINGLPTDDDTDWVLYTEANANPVATSFTQAQLEAAGLSTSEAAAVHTSVTTNGFTSGTAGTGFLNIPGLGSTVTNLILMTVSKNRPTRAVKFVVPTTLTFSNVPEPDPHQFTAVVGDIQAAVDLSATTAAMFPGTIHQVSPYRATATQMTQVGTATAPATGTAMIEATISTTADALEVTETQTVRFWAEARHTFGYAWSVRLQRTTEHTALAANVSDSFDLYLPTVDGGRAFGVFLTDVNPTTGTSRAGHHIFTGTQLALNSVDFALNTALSYARRRGSIPVAITSNTEQFTFQQAANIPGDVLAAEVNNVQAPQVEGAWNELSGGQLRPNAGTRHFGG